MRTKEAEKQLVQWGLIAVVLGCAAWIVVRDATMLFPLMGVAGGLLALHREYLKDLRQQVENKFNAELPDFIEHNKEPSRLVITVFVSRWAKLIWDGE